MTPIDPTADAALTRPGCEPGRDALQRFLDGEAAWDTPAAELHRAACADCREELALARGFVQLPPPIVPSDLAGKVLNAAVSDRRRRRRRRFAGAGLSLAASVLVAVFAVRSRLDSQTVRENSYALTAPKGEPTRPLGDAMAEARDALVALSKRTATETRDRSVLLTRSRWQPLAPAEAPHWLLRRHSPARGSHCCSPGERARCNAVHYGPEPSNVRGQPLRHGCCSRSSRCQARTGRHTPLPRTSRACARISH